MKSKVNGSFKVVKNPFCSLHTYRENLLAENTIFVQVVDRINEFLVAKLQDVESGYGLSIKLEYSDRKKNQRQWE